MFAFYTYKSHRDIIESCVPNLISIEQYTEIYNKFKNLGIQVVKSDEETKQEEEETKREEYYNYQ
jgi:hypothetical protein